MYHFKPNAYGGQPDIPSRSAKQVLGSSARNPHPTIQSSQVWIAPTPPIALRGRRAVHDSNDVRLLRTSTMPEARDEDRELPRSSSGGSILRRRTFDEQKKMSEARANELITRFELSDVKNTALNKKGTFNSTNTVSLRTISTQEAMRLIAKEQEEIINRTGNENPLLTKRQVEEKNKVEDKIRRMAEWKKNRESEGLVTLGGLVNDQNRGAARLAQSYSGDSGFGQFALQTKSSEEHSIEIKSPGTGITLAHADPLNPQATPVERKANQRGYKASNGKTYDLDTLC
jgi:hypothetical protein